MGEYIDKLFMGGMVIIGALLIVFRKSFVRSTFRAQFKHAKPSQKDQFKQLEEIGYGGPLYKFVEVFVVIAGIFMVTSSLSDFLFPTGQKYIGFIFMLFVLSLFAAGIACFFLFKLILPFLNRKVDRYINEKYADLYLQSQSPSPTERYKAVKSTWQIDDPMLQKLRRRSNIYAIIWFAVLFIVLLSIEYAIVRATS